MIEPIIEYVSVNGPYFHAVVVPNLGTIVKEKYLIYGGTAHVLGTIIN